MTKQEKIHFVTDLTNSLQTRLVQNIKAGKIPEDWDGIELRELIAELVQRQRVANFKGRRKRDYRNTMLVNNL